MIESLNETINFMILLSDEIEIIIRGEKTKENKGIIVKIYKKENIDSISEKIKQLTLKECIDFLDENNITYKEVEFL